MSMTKKQKQAEIPKLQSQISELEEDLKNVKSSISTSLIAREISHKKEIIEKYQQHIDDPYVNRRRY